MCLISIFCAPHPIHLAKRRIQRAPITYAQRYQPNTNNEILYYNLSTNLSVRCMTRMEMCNNIGIIGYGDICELVGLSLRGGRDWILVANDLLFWSRTYNTTVAGKIDSCAVWLYFWFIDLSLNMRWIYAMHHRSTSEWMAEPNSNQSKNNSIMHYMI